MNSSLFETEKAINRVWFCLRLLPVRYSDCVHKSQSDPTTTPR